MKCVYIIFPTKFGETMSFQDVLEVLEAHEGRKMFREEIVEECMANSPGLTKHTANSNLTKALKWPGVHSEDEQRKRGVKLGTKRKVYYYVRPARLEGETQ